MGLAVPSVAEASRGLPSVKAFVPPADDEIVTSVAFSVPPPEHSSPELALVDPDLAARLRAHLPEPTDALAPRLTPRPDSGPAVGTAVVPAPRSAGSTEPDRELAVEIPRPAVAPASVPSNVRPLRPAFVEAAGSEPVALAPRTADLAVPARPQPEFEVVPAHATPALAASPEPADARPPEGAVPSGPTARALPFVTVLRLPGAADRHLLIAFAVGAAIASLVVVGVIAALGESDGGSVGVADGSPPSLVPPAVVAPSPSPPPAAAPKPSGGAKKAPATASKKAAPSKKTPAAAAKKKASASAAAKKQAPATTKKKASGAKTSGAPKPAAAAPARRFAWAPVDGAVGYRVELFRGDRQVLRATTKQPAYDLPASWRHNGAAQRLTEGSYRWYVWPVLASGPAAEAVVQARLDVP